MKEGESGFSSQRGSEHTLVLTATSRGDSPGFNFSSNVPDKEWLAVALTCHSEPVMVEGKPPLSPSCTHAFAILVRETAIPNTEGKSCITRESALPLCPPKEHISGRPWPRTLMVAASRGFSMHRDFSFSFLQYILSSYLCFPPAPVASHPSLS